jgi:hypothetical protein
MHQRIAGTADEVYLGAMGCALRLKPGPVTLMDPGDIERIIEMMDPARAE